MLCAALAHCSIFCYADAPLRVLNACVTTCPTGSNIAVRSCVNDGSAGQAIIAWTGAPQGQGVFSSRHSHLSVCLCVCLRLPNALASRFIHGFRRGSRAERAQERVWPAFSDVDADRAEPPPACGKACSNGATLVGPLSTRIGRVSESARRVLGGACGLGRARLYPASTGGVENAPF